MDPAAAVAVGAAPALVVRPVTAPAASVAAAVSPSNFLRFKGGPFGELRVPSLQQARRSIFACPGPPVAILLRSGERCTPAGLCQFCERCWHGRPSQLGSAP